MGEITLVVMAAGIGSRYGGIKQLESVGPSGEIIIDYSIYDAIKAGFNKIVFIIRKDLEKDFKEIIGRRIEQQIKVEYVFQELDDLPSGFTKPIERTKPWGTGQAILSCKNVISEPFAVINADDYYGKEAFHLVYEFLDSPDYREDQYCMAGFVLGNTLSENGTVTRGVCKANEKSILVDISETSGIAPEGDHAVAKDSNGNVIEIALDSIVSMNMWGFKPSLFQQLETGFIDFLSNIPKDEIKKEYLLPTIVGNLIKDKTVEVTVLKTNDRWVGVTYKEDKEIVVKSIRTLVDKGEYPIKLFS
ncbi:MAG: sugar phosphate nucleotidyltransferase [Mobilitalea sp.]